jgi:two-component system NarL family sensor kinase
MSELATLTALAQALSGPANLTDSLEAALTTVADVLGLETGWVWLLDESGEPRLAAARALPEALRDHPDAMHGDCYCLKTFGAGDLRRASNVNVVWCSRLAVLNADDSADDIGRLQCHASVPLIVDDRRLGMLNVASRDWRVLTEAELSLLTTAGALVSLAVERSRLETVSARAIAAEERNKLAREIHDTIAQGLAAVTMQLETADAISSQASRISECRRRSVEHSRSRDRRCRKRGVRYSISAKHRSKVERCVRRSTSSFGLCRLMARALD